MARNTSRNVASAKRVPGKTETLTVVILAAGFSKRMSTLGVRSMIKLDNGLTILDNQIATIETEFPKSDIYVVVGYQADRLIRKYFGRVKLIENQCFKDTNAVKSLALALMSCGSGGLLVIHGDIVFNNETVEKLTQNGSCVVADTKDQIKPEEVGLIFQDGKVVNFSYGLETKWGQIAYLEGNELQELKNLTINPLTSKFSLYEIFNLIIENNGSFSVLENEDARIVEVDCCKDLTKIEL